LLWVVPEDVLAVFEELDIAARPRRAHDNVLTFAAPFGATARILLDEDISVWGSFKCTARRRDSERKRKRRHGCPARARDMHVGAEVWDRGLASDMPLALELGYRVERLRASADRSDRDQ
jgi:hypothetical protein